MITYRDCIGPGGGGNGVVYKLYSANRHFNIFKATYLFKNISLEDSKKDLQSVFTSIPINKSSQAVKKLIRKLPISNHLATGRKLLKAGAWIRNIGKEYKFSKEDVYIFHDVESAYAFCKEYKYKRTMLVYHQQGSLYREWQAFWGIERELYHKYLNTILRYVINEVGVLSFPSKGARECLMDSEPELLKIIHDKDYRIMYNGYDQKEDIQASAKILSIINEIPKKNLVISSVGVLNRAKGVDRIPTKLKQLKEKGILFTWILIGNGDLEKRVVDEIAKNEIYEETIWIKDFISHDDVQAIFKHTDIYMMLHRWSIFDFATIEAMACGCLPVLSDVGGNREVIVDGENGLILKDDKNDIDALIEVLNNSETIEQMKEKAKEYEMNKFGERDFLLRYEEAIRYIISKR